MRLIINETIQDQLFEPFRTETKYIGSSHLDDDMISLFFIFRSTPLICTLDDFDSISYEYLYLIFECVA